MPWFNVDDKLAFHRKVIRAGNTAMGLWVRAGSHCADQLTDGFVSSEMVGVLGTLKQAERLVSAGLWLKTEGGFQFHEWSTDNRNPTRDQVLADRAYNARKAALHRDADLLSAVRRRDSGRCRYCGCLVEWGNRRGPGGGTYDHVDPSGPNTLENLVVACRGCNSRKGGKALADTSLTMLTPGSLGGNSKASAAQEDAYQVRSESDLEQSQNKTGSEQGPLHSTPLPKEEQKKTSSSSPRKRGTRLPGDFTVSQDMVAWARTKVPQVDGRLETEKFINYWTAKSGKDATKVDWPAVWRNWMLTAAERAPTRQTHAAPTDDFAAKFLAKGQPAQSPLRALPGGA